MKGKRKKKEKKIARIKRHWCHCKTCNHVFNRLLLALLMSFCVGWHTSINIYNMFDSRLVTTEYFLYIYSLSFCHLICFCCCLGQTEKKQQQTGQFFDESIPSKYAGLWQNNRWPPLFSLIQMNLLFIVIYCSHFQFKK